MRPHRYGPVRDGRALDNRCRIALVALVGFGIGCTAGGGESCTACGPGTGSAAAGGAVGADPGAAGDSGAAGASEAGGSAGSAAAAGRGGTTGAGGSSGGGQAGNAGGSGNTGGGSGGNGGNGGLAGNAGKGGGGGAGGSGGNGGNGGSAGNAGKGGGAGAGAGTTGSGGSAGTTGAAGASGAAGTTGAAGRGGTTGGGGTGGTAGTTGSAGTTGAGGSAGTGGAAGSGGAGGSSGGAGGGGQVVLSIDFIGGRPPMGGAGGAAGAGGMSVVSAPAMTATEVAGVKPVAHWNGAANISGTLAGLVLADGTATAASATWNSPSMGTNPGEWTMGFADMPGNTRMMNGYLDPVAAAMPAVVTVSALPASITAAGYDVYVYVDGDVGTTTNTRMYNYSIGSATFMVTQSAPVPTSFTSFTLAPSGGAGNYFIFRNVTGASFTLTATPGTATGNNMRAPVNGLQIVAPTGS